MKKSFIASGPGCFNFSTLWRGIKLEQNKSLMIILGFFENRRNKYHKREFLFSINGLMR